MFLRAYELLNENVELIIISSGNGVTSKITDQNSELLSKIKNSTAKNILSDTVRLSVEKGKKILIGSNPSDGWVGPSLKIEEGKMFYRKLGKNISVTPYTSKTVFHLKYSPKTVRFDLVTDSGGVVNFDKRNLKVYGEPIQISAKAMGGLEVCAMGNYFWIWET